jgi:glycosyltransferase involved in cell wall biosynthesis/peptidoglycan/xylan/chitin deacetylase (PgdA/CDA1 family)
LEADQDGKSVNMNILLVCNDFPNRWKPTKGVFNLNLARALAARHEVRVVAPIPWMEDVSFRSLAGKVTYGECNEPHDGLSVTHPRYYYPPRILRNQHDWFYWVSVRRTVQQILAKFRPDIVLGYWVHPDGAVACRIARHLRVPCGVIVGGSDVLILPRHPARRRCVVNTLNCVDAILTVNRHLRERVADLGVDPRKVHTWYQGVDKSRFFPGDRLAARQVLGLSASENLLLWVGRMVPVKGLDVLISAASELRNRGLSYRLCLVGDGPLRPSVEAAVANRGLAERITFLGALRPEQLPDWYRAADVMVLPSRSEGLPNVLRESLACGTPFVASDVGGIPEIARPGQDRLVPPEDPIALADALTETLASKREPRDRSFEAISWEESAEALIQSLTPLIERSKARQGLDALKAQTRGESVAMTLSWRQLLRATLTRCLPRSIFLVRGRRNSSSVCLTFDDGPHPEFTPPLLEVLKREGIVATFFVVGQEAAKYPHLVRRMVDEGHLVGNHSYFHGKPQQTSTQQLLEEVRATRQLITDLVGKPPAHFRPPHGKVTTAKLWSLWRAGQKIVLWNMDPRDWDCRSASELQERFEENPIRGGDVVLLHDDRPHAFRALPAVIAAARTRGLSFDLVSQWTR